MELITLLLILVLSVPLIEFLIKKWNIFNLFFSFLFICININFSNKFNYLEKTVIAIISLLFIFNFLKNANFLRKKIEIFSITIYLKIKNYIKNIYLILIRILETNLKNIIKKIDINSKIKFNIKINKKWIVMFNIHIKNLFNYVKKTLIFNSKLRMYFNKISNKAYEGLKDYYIFISLIIIFGIILINKEKISNELYYKGIEYYKINKKLFLLFEKTACYLNNYKACYTLGKYYKSIEKEPNIALIYFDKSCKSGYARSCNIAGKISCKLLDEEKTIFYYKTSCDKLKNAIGCYSLGIDYLKEKCNLNNDFIEAKKYLKKACKYNKVLYCPIYYENFN